MKPLDKRLFHAVDHGKLDAAGKALDAGADVNARNKYGRTPLHDACRDGRPETARLLIDAGADVNVKGKHGDTPLHKACEFGNEGRTDLARLLLEKGADVNAKSGNGNTPLDVAMQDHPWTASYAAIVNLFRQHAPETALTSVIKLPAGHPWRETMLDWYREHHPELVFEAFCTQA